MAYCRRRVLWPLQACSWESFRWPWASFTCSGRPLSLATIFAALSGSFVGVVNVFVMVGRSQAPTFPQVAWFGFAEALVPIFVGFGCLTLAWLCVAVGLWRRP